MTWSGKDEARRSIWTTLREEGVARFPYPVEGRIPNVAGADRAAERLLEHFEAEYETLDHVKVNPDSPQKHLRRRLLEHETVVYVPTPRLEGGFMRFDPHAIPEEHYEDASMLSRWDSWAESVELHDLPQFDAVVVGSVAVTRSGRRCGKGEGYSDLELGILQELGHDPVPVATTVHPLQIVESLPREDHDLMLSAIATSEEVVETDLEHPRAVHLDWSKLSDEDLDEMPILRELRAD